MKHKEKTEKKGRFHPFARNVILGSIQFTGIWYIFAGILHLIAVYTPDYFLTLSYRDAALETAPVVLAAGIIGALICDLVLRRTGDQEK